MSFVGSVEWSPARKRIEERAAAILQAREEERLVPELRRRNSELNARVGELVADLRAARVEIDALLSRLTVRDTTANTILLQVAGEHAIPVDIICSRIRTLKVAAARHEFFYRVADATGLSLCAIAAVIGGMDHTSVLNGIHVHAMRRGLPLPRGMKPRKWNKKKQAWSLLPKLGESAA